jgi:gliding motility-associated lipoprotein GldH
MLKLFSFIGVFLVATILMGGCGNQTGFDSVSSIPSNGWSAAEPVVFEFPVSDTTKAYDIYIHIRNQQSYAFSNLWMFIEIAAPNGYIKRDTFEIMLADETGRWYGKGIGSINSMLVPYKQEAIFPLRGVYKISLQQAMYDDLLEDIIDVGLRIQPHQPR